MFPKERLAIIKAAYVKGIFCLWRHIF